MAIIGSKSTFAVEYRLDDESPGRVMTGSFCYWCSQACLGSLQIKISLRDVLLSLYQIEKYNGRRQGQRFADMEKESVFDILQGTMFCLPNSKQDFDAWIPVSYEEQWARFTIYPSVGGPELHGLYYIEGPDYGRLLYRLDIYSPTQSTVEVRLKPGEVDSVIKQFCTELESVYSRRSDIYLGREA